MNKITPTDDLLKAYKYLRILKDASPEQISIFPEIPQCITDVVRVKSGCLFASGTGDIIITLEPTERLTELVTALKTWEGNNQISPKT